jgi:hypothetical protein
MPELINGTYVSAIVQVSVIPAANELQVVATRNVRPATSIVIMSFWAKRGISDQVAYGVTAKGTRDV